MPTEKAVFVFLICAAVVWFAACNQDDKMSKCEEKAMTRESIDEAVERARTIRHKYEDLFWRQPTVHGVGIGLIEDAYGEETGQVGFVIDVTEKVDQSTLPSEDRISDCLEGVPVQIREEPMHTLPLRRVDSDEEESNGTE